MEFYIERANLGADIEPDLTPSGTSVVELRVAVNFNKKVGDEWETETDWHRLSAFGKVADKIMKMNLSKGDPITAKGTIRVSQKDDKWYTNFYINRIQKLARMGEE